MTDVVASPMGCEARTSYPAPGSEFRKGMELGKALGYGNGFEAGYGAGLDVQVPDSVLAPTVSTEGIAAALGVRVAGGYQPSRSPNGGRTLITIYDETTREQNGYGNLSDELIGQLERAVDDFIPEHQSPEVPHRLAAMAARYTIQHPEQPQRRAVRGLLRRARRDLKEAGVKQMTSAQMRHVLDVVFSAREVTLDYLKVERGE